MATFMNKHDAKLVLTPTFVLSPGQSREVTEDDAAQMNRTVVDAWVSAGMLEFEGDMPVAEDAADAKATQDAADAKAAQDAVDAKAAQDAADAKAAQDAADAKKAAKGKGGMPGVSK